VDLGVLAGDAEQARLADPGRPLEQHDHPVALSCLEQKPLDKLDLLLPLQQGSGPRADHPPDIGDLQRGSQTESDSGH
jgi:hypothetical protein